MTKNVNGRVFGRVYRRGAGLLSDTASNVIKNGLDLEAQTRVPSLASRDTRFEENVPSAATKESV
jgi:hypothetical protein